jgi:hypothetical protein
MTTKDVIATALITFGVLAFFIAAFVAGVTSEKTEADKQVQMYGQCVAWHASEVCRYILPEAN